MMDIPIDKPLVLVTWLDAKDGQTGWHSIDDIEKEKLDTLGKRTVGVGHLCVEDFWEDDKEYSEKFLLEILEKDLGQAIIGARELMMKHGCMDINEKAEEILIEMVFQLGKTGVSKFKNMWKALSELNYVGASYEMLDSKWAKQTPNRAKDMAQIMKTIT
jgi:lysozyme